MPGRKGCFVPRLLHMYVFPSSFFIEHFSFILTILNSENFILLSLMKRCISVLSGALNTAGRPMRVVFLPMRKRLHRGPESDLRIKR